MAQVFRRADEMDGVLGVAADAILEHGRDRFGAAGERLWAVFMPLGMFVAVDPFISYLERIKPKLFIDGHQHVNRETRVAETMIVGVSASAD